MLDAVLYWVQVGIVGLTIGLLLILLLMGLTLLAAKYCVFMGVDDDA